IDTLIKTGAGALYVQGNAAASNFNLTGGIYSVTTNGGLGSSAASIAFDGGTLQFAGAMSTTATRTMTLGAGGGAVDTNGFAVTVANAIDGAGALTKRGADVLALSGANTYSGGTIISAGTLLASGNDALGDAAGTVTVAAGASLQLS